MFKRPITVDYDQALSLEGVELSDSAKKLLSRANLDIDSLRHGAADGRPLYFWSRLAYVLEIGIYAQLEARFREILKEKGWNTLQPLDANQVIAREAIISAVVADPENAAAGRFFTSPIDTEKIRINLDDGKQNLLIYNYLQGKSKSVTLSELLKIIESASAISDESDFAKFLIYRLFIQSSNLLNRLDAAIDVDVDIEIPDDLKDVSNKNFIMIRKTVAEHTFKYAPIDIAIQLIPEVIKRDEFDELLQIVVSRIINDDQTTNEQKIELLKGMADRLSLVGDYDQSPKVYQECAIAIYQTDPEFGETLFIEFERTLYSPDVPQSAKADYIRQSLESGRWFYETIIERLETLKRLGLQDKYKVVFTVLGLLSNIAIGNLEYVRVKGMAALLSLSFAISILEDTDLIEYQDLLNENIEKALNTKAKLDRLIDRLNLMKLIGISKYRRVTANVMVMMFEALPPKDFVSEPDLKVWWSNTEHLMNHPHISTIDVREHRSLFFKNLHSYEHYHEVLTDFNQLYYLTNEDLRKLGVLLNAVWDNATEQEYIAFVKFIKKLLNSHLSIASQITHSLSELFLQSSNDLDEKIREMQLARIKRRTSPSPVPATGQASEVGEVLKHTGFLDIAWQQEFVRVIEELGSIAPLIYKKYIAMTTEVEKQEFKESLQKFREQASQNTDLKPLIQALGIEVFVEQLMMVYKPVGLNSESMQSMLEELLIKEASRGRDFHLDLAYFGIGNREKEIEIVETPAIYQWTNGKLNKSTYNKLAEFANKLMESIAILHPGRYDVVTSNAKRSKAMTLLLKRVLSSERCDRTLEENLKFSIKHNEEWEDVKIPFFIAALALFIGANDLFRDLMEELVRADAGDTYRAEQLMPTLIRLRELIGSAKGLQYELPHHSVEALRAFIKNRMPSVLNVDETEIEADRKLELSEIIVQRLAAPTGVYHKLAELLDSVIKQSELVNDPNGNSRVIKGKFVWGHTIATAFSKDAAGICTGSDTKRFSEEGYIDLNLIDESGALLMNTQVIVFHESGKKQMLVRGINPLVSVVNAQNAEKLVDAVIAEAIEVGREKGFHKVVFADHLGGWHADSNRPECSKYIRSEYLTSDKEVSLQQTINISAAMAVDKGYVLWEKEA